MTTSLLKFKVEIRKLILSKLACCILLALFCNSRASAQDRTSQFDSTWLKSVVSMERCSTPANSQAIENRFFSGFFTQRHVI